MSNVTFKGNWGGTSSTFANWRQGPEAFHAAMLSLSNFTQTSDTGQLDLSSLTALPGTGTVGYFIYRFNDSLSSTAPIFVKVTLNVGTNSRTAYVIAIGSGTDGAGNLTTTIFTGASIIQSNLPPSATVYDNIISAGDGYFAILLGVNAGTAGYTPGEFLFERRIDGSNVLHGDAVVVLQKSGAGLATIAACRSSDGSNNLFNGSLTIPLFSGTATMALGVTPVFPLTMVVAPTGIPWQPVSFFAVPPPDAPFGVFGVTVNGVSRPYIVVEGPVISPVSYGGSTTTVPARSFAIRWE